MAGIIVCNVCCLELNNSSVIPKMLDCGHTFCSPCITEMIKSNPFCPECRQTIESTETSLPVNYSILDAVEALKNLRTLDKDNTFTRSTETIRKKCLEMKDVLMQMKSDVEFSLPLIENGIKKLNDLIDSKTPFPKANEILTELEKDFKKAEEVLHYKSIKKTFLATISLNDFEDKPSYLITIYHRIGNGDKIYTTHQVKNDIKYGKISFFDNKLFFHSLSLSEVPQDASLIAFADVKKCQISNPHVFLKITVKEKELIYTLVIKMYDRSMCEGFVAFCTGEYGYSYKDSLYTNGRDRFSNHCNVLHVEKGEHLSLSDYKFDGEELSETAFSGSENDMFLYLEPNGTFDIYSLRCEGSSTLEFAHGKVVLPKEKIPITYSDSSFLKITECGLVINL